MGIINSYDFDIIEFTYWIINNIKDGADMLKENVVGNYPEDEPTFPLAVVSISEEDTDYDFSSTPLSTELTASIDMYHGAKTDVIRVQRQVEKVMLGLGFVRQPPTAPFKDTSSNKYKITERFIIKYSFLKNQLERTSA